MGGEKLRVPIKQTCCLALIEMIHNETQKCYSLVQGDVSFLPFPKGGKFTEKVVTESMSFGRCIYVGIR